MARLPEGTITFMLTDLQGSSQAWEKQPKAMRSAMARHDAILASTVGDHAGELVEAGREGDSVLAVFRTAATAAACALDIQKNFANESWPEGLDLKVRVALHTGEAQLREGHYFGAALNRCARLLATCHPGQILLTKASEAILADEVPPDAELRDLGLHRLKDLARPEQVFQLNDLGRPSEFPRIQSLPQQQTNMPHYLTNFVGRSGELAALQSMLSTSRMVTLTGAGGSGQTRLAAELGRACLSIWPGGVWWVELASVSDSRHVPGAVLAALELHGGGPALDMITAWLAARRAVLILDNCEHLVATCAEFCQMVLRRCPELTVVATSRQALGVPGEARWPVSAMATADAVQLFEARARLIVPDLRITASNRQTVTEICERLDGMPLAIELAAARMDIMAEHEILSQLSDRFHLLTGGNRTAPERQQTMLATIDWSYRLLTDEEAVLFRRLSVFRGGFTLESAQAVCGGGTIGSVLELLAGLVQKSMTVAERQAGSANRYRLLESQVTYAEERLREAEELELIGRRHYEYFRGSLNSKTIAWFSPRAVTEAAPGVAEAEWKVRESGNLWAAVRWARGNADDLGLSLAVDIAHSEDADYAEARRVITELVDTSSVQGVPRVWVLVTAAYLAARQGAYSVALRVAESSVDLARQVGDPEALAVAMWGVGINHLNLGHLDAATETFEEALSFLRGSGNLRLLAHIKSAVAGVAIETGDYSAARELLIACVATGRAGGDLYGTARYLDNLACAQLGLNAHQDAAASWKEGLSILRRFNKQLGLIDCLEGISLVAGVDGDDRRALRLAAAARRFLGEWSHQPDPWLRAHSDKTQRIARSRLGARRSHEAWNEGWAMSVDQAIDYALAESEPETVIDAGPLSRREREVAKLVASGMTNRQIAERLFIAERTAEGHVERIRNKLELHSRAHLAAWAVEHGLASPLDAPPPDRTKARETLGGPPSHGRQKPG